MPLPPLEKEYTRTLRGGVSSGPSSRKNLARVTKGDFAAGLLEFKKTPDFLCEIPAIHSWQWCLMLTPFWMKMTLSAMFVA